MWKCLVIPFFGMCLHRFLYSSMPRPINFFFLNYSHYTSTSSSLFKMELGREIDQHIIISAIKSFSLRWRSLAAPKESFECQLTEQLKMFPLSVFQSNRILNCWHKIFIISILKRQITCLPKAYFSASLHIFGILKSLHLPTVLSPTIIQCIW